MKLNSSHNQGFTLIELIMVILLLGIVSVVATVKWPGDMKESAAVKEFKRIIRYAQHHAMTREYLSGDAWGLTVSANKYTIENQDGNPPPIQDFDDRYLLGDSAITITDPTGGDGLWFNGLGEPIDSSGAQLGSLTYTIAGTENLTVCPQTGYVVEGMTCP